ncbi:MAG: 50S ribosomal protein L24 [Pseudomonadota bacterium]
MAHVKKNDTVKVLSGKHKGRRGKILKVMPEKSTAIVERLNMIKRHVKSTGQAGKQGGIVEKEAPIPFSQLMLVCPKCSKASRTGRRFLEDGTKVRYCKKCNEQID